MSSLRFCQDVYTRRKPKTQRPASRQARKDADTSRFAFLEQRKRGGTILQLASAR
jgi:hypothetical protein